MPNEQPEQSPSDASIPMLKCPRCRARYPATDEIGGKRVRCPSCGHVWRDQRQQTRDVAGALGQAADAWAELGSTAVGAVDHASTVAQLVARTRKRDAFPASEWVGRRIGRYELKAVLGQGAMGYVYEAHDHELDRDAAVKLLPRLREAGDADTIGEKMFLQEARIAAKLQHPNIVTIFEVGEFDGVYYYVMELVHGSTLLDLVKRCGPLPMSQACYVVAHAARALAAAHRRSIVHRDVKPGNIMIDVEGRVKVTDFGLADVAGGSVPESGAMALGTPGWISPEVARQEKAVKESDIYGLGLTLYYALTGDRLIQSTSKSGMIRQQKVASDIRHEDLPDEWPERLKDAIVQCLHVDIRDRYHDGDMLAADLVRAIQPNQADLTGTLDLGPSIYPVKLVPRWVAWMALAILTATSATLALWYYGVINFGA
ncbi:MAG: protein kinase [Phycisphaerales bacterium]|nr:protein kinase [Phycisphaerales bacterium]MCB9862422.1 protein kinase [Phycisphaerales bacterium]